jgi:hypothetical protein
MSPKSTLIALRHDADLVSALRADGPWAHEAGGADGLANAILSFLVDRRRANPVQVGDGAFTTVDVLARTIAADRGCAAADVADALRALQADRLVESCGAKVGQARWRATERAVYALRPLAAVA